MGRLLIEMYGTYFLYIDEGCLLTCRTQNIFQVETSWYEMLIYPGNGNGYKSGLCGKEIPFCLSCKKWEVVQLLSSNSPTQK